MAVFLFVLGMCVGTVIALTRHYVTKHYRDRINQEVERTKEIAKK